MEGQDTDVRLWYWIMGYFSAIIVIMVAEKLSAYLSSLPSSESNIIFSPNGKGEEKEDEKATGEIVELVKEYTENE